MTFSNKFVINEEDDLAICSLSNNHAESDKLKDKYSNVYLTFLRKENLNRLHFAEMNTNSKEIDFSF